MELGIKNHYSSSAHPQANWQVEVTNKTLIGMIKKRLEGSKGLWPKELPGVLWAYRTTARALTGETPFSLAFETEAVIPVEIGLTLSRTTNFDTNRNDKGLRGNLDLLEEKRSEATLRVAAYKQKMAKYYNSRVKTRRFVVGDLVLKKVTQDQAKGKLGPNWEGSYKVMRCNRLGTYHLEDL